MQRIWGSMPWASRSLSGWRAKQSETFKLMESRLLKAIINPAMTATWLLGLWLAWKGRPWEGITRIPRQGK